MTTPDEMRAMAERLENIIEDLAPMSIKCVDDAIALLRSIAEETAAAPDLLEALDSLVSACELPGDHCEIEQALPRAKAAISKAKGAA